MEGIRRRLDGTIWTRSLVLFAIALFCDRFGQGLLNGARMNFFVDTIGLSGSQVLWLEGIRELPGLALIFIAALTMRMPLMRQATLSLVLMAVGYALFAFVGSYAGLLAAEVTASFGFHLWTPLHHAIGLSLSTKESAGRVLGSLAAVGSLAAIAGMGAIALVSSLFQDMNLRNYYLIGGGFILVSGLVFFILPKDLGQTKVKPARILVKGRYWLYYVLIFFSGARKLILGSLITLILVQNFHLKVQHMSALTFLSSLLTFMFASRLGALIDRFGERVTTTASYAILAVCCLAFATINQLWILLFFWVLIRLVMPLGMALSTYVYRTAPPEELTPTLTAGVTFDHISSVGVPFLVSALLPFIAYRGVFVASAALILISIPFARALQVRVDAMPQPTLSTAD
jgi:predicted MFS family arabinose efflux permease